MRKFGVASAVVVIVCTAWVLSPVSGQEAKPGQEFSKAKILLGDARRAAQVGAEASALEKYGEALIILQQIERKKGSLKPEESGSLSEAETGYIRTLSGMVIRLQNVVTQRKAIEKQQGEIIRKIDLILKKNKAMMKFLLENRDLIEKIEGSLGS